MRTVSVVKASDSLGKYAKSLKREIVVVTRGRRAVAALVPLKNVDPESLALSMHPEFLALVKKARAELAAGRSLSLAEMRARVLPPDRSPNPRLQRTARARRR
jgi:antitoxin (DNA-binding transcriptional repressor) of toxin-antitoxin stability system